MSTNKLVAFLRRILCRRPITQRMSDPTSTHQMQMALTVVAATRDQEIGCDEAYAFLDAYADHISRGADAATLMPLVHHHLEMCPDCREEFDALLAALCATAYHPAPRLLPDRTPP